MTTSMEKYNRLKNNLEELKLYGFAINLESTLTGIENGSYSFVDGLYRMTELEMKLKAERTYQGCVKQAGFPFLKTLQEYDFSFQPTVNKEQVMGLSQLRFIENNENILLIGSPGVGKTHIAVSVGIEAAKNRLSTYFIHCNDLISQLKKAKLENRLEKRLKFFYRYKLLIIDEVGFLPINEEEAKLFFQLISKRYEKRSTIITTNKELSQWSTVFKDPVITNAILDRLLHHCHLLKIVGPSYRTKNMADELIE